jgi:hypothetical protein
MRVMSFAFFLFLSTATTLIISPTARAEQWNKETVVSFTSPVEVPGKILPPGTYVFKLADSQSDRQLVQILTQDQRQVLASIQTIPDYHLHPAEKPLITLAERPAGRPEALQAWFYPGDNYGVQFVYPNSPVQTATQVEPEVASNTDPAATIPALIEAVTPTKAELIAPASPVMPVLAQPEHETQVLAENKAPQSEELLTLPKTAGNVLILPLVGVLLLGCGSMLCMVRQRA